jgi:peptidoglycan hydrolase-like protein with peptidoglycan-binding domain
VFKAGRVLKQGMKGEDVLAMERKLDLLKYFPGEVDGRFDSQTWQGVMAFQKLNGLKRSAQFDVATQEHLFTATVPGGVIPNGGLPRIEVDLSRQVALIFDDYGLERVVAVSSGSNKAYCSNALPKDGERNFKPYKVCGDARTPRGNYKVQRRIKGVRQSSLGTLINPLYFNGGYAIHGSPSVPGYPASHGCVRVTNVSSNWIFDNVEDGTPVYVFD